MEKPLSRVGAFLFRVSRRAVGNELRNFGYRNCVVHPMKIRIGLLSYVATITALLGGAIGAFLLLAPEPSVGQPASAEVRKALVSPKIAAWQARMAIPDPPQEKVNIKPSAVIPVYRHPVQETIRIQQPIARVKPKPTRAPNTELALGYAETPSSSASEQPFSAIRDKRDRHGN